jgi:hypothetical protein
MEVWKCGGIRHGAGQWKSGHTVDVIAFPYKDPVESPTKFLLQLSSIMPAFSFTTVVNPNIAHLQHIFETLRVHLVALANTIPEDHPDLILQKEA